MDLRLKGYTAVVTGSSSGIGEAIARRLAAEGSAVVVHGRRAAAVDAVVAAIRGDGGDARGLAADLADPADCDRFILDALLASSVDILVNCAGAFVNRGWDETTPGDWLEVYAVNVAAVVRCIQGFVPVTRMAGWGRHRPGRLHRQPAGGLYQRREPAHRRRQHRRPMNRKDASRHALHAAREQRPAG